MQAHNPQKNVRGVLKIYDFSMWKKMRGNQRFMSSPFDGSKNMLVPYFTGQHLTLVHFGLFKFFRQINLYYICIYSLLQDLKFKYIVTM